MHDSLTLSTLLNSTLLNITSIFFSSVMPLQSVSLVSLVQLLKQRLEVRIRLPKWVLQPKHPALPPYHVLIILSITGPRHTLRFQFVDQDIKCRFQRHPLRLNHLLAWVIVLSCVQMSDTTGVYAPHRGRCSPNTSLQGRSP